MLVAGKFVLLPIFGNFEKQNAIKRWEGILQFL